MKRMTALVIAAIMATTAFVLCSCGGDNGESVVPKVFKGKWEMCGLAPKDEAMSAGNIIAGDDLKEIYGMDPGELSKNTVEFDKYGGMKPYTDGSIPGYGTDMTTRISDTEVCFGINISELDGKDLYDDPIKMDVHARIVDDYLFVWEEYTNTDEYDESDTYQVYQRAK